MRSGDCSSIWTLADCTNFDRSYKIVVYHDIYHHFEHANRAMMSVIIDIHLPRFRLPISYIFYVCSF